MIAGEMVNHLLPKMCKQRLPPVHITVLELVDNREDPVDLALNLNLMTLQLRSLCGLALSSGIYEFWDVFHVMVFVKDVPDFGEVGLKNTKGITVPIFDNGSHANVASLQAL